MSSTDIFKDLLVVNIYFSGRHLIFITHPNVTGPEKADQIFHQFQTNEVKTTVFNIQLHKKQ